MPLVQEKPFTPQRTEEERAKDNSTVFTIRLNKEEESKIQAVSPYIQQTKMSTLLKQLALLNADDVLQDKKTQARLIVAINNVRKNMETGVPVDMPSDRQILGSVIQND